MGIFGWDYPAGCSSTPFDEPDPPCAICGEDIEVCSCPECPICGDIGNPRCYLDHGMRRTELQKFTLECAERQWEEDAKSWNDYAYDWEAETW